MHRLATYVRTIPNVLTTPAAEIEILTFNAQGPVLAVRPFCRIDHYWQVYFDTNRAISEVCAVNVA
jgi:small conductance mechanosensitive channel